MMGLKKIFLSLLCSVLLAGWASAQDTTDTSQGSYFLSFVKKVYFNPTILLATQDFHEQHNVRVLVLPDLNGAEENQITGFERGMQKIIRFLIEGDDEGSIRFYFDAEDTDSPFSFVCSEELWCKFDKHKDSIEYYLNAPFQNTTFTINSHALFEASIEGVLAYAEKCLQQNTSECSDKSEHQTLEINTKPLAISVHTTSGTHYDIDYKQHDLLESHYAKAHDVFTDQDWYAPSKFMVAGGEFDEPIAIAINKHETLFKKQNLVFRTLYNNQIIPIEPSSTNDTIKLLLPKDLPSGNPVEVSVKYTSTVDSIQYTVGFFMVYVYEPKEVKLNILAANGYTLGTAEQTAIENQLKAVYDPVGVHFTVEKKEWMPDSEWSNMINIESSGLLSNYPPDLRDWVNGIQDLNDYDEDEYYLVFGLTTTELAGYMPRARNIGFVFAGATSPGKTAAHELGHGVYHLRHIFAEEELGEGTKGMTANIMDYADDPADNLHDLYLHQWKFIDDPASINWFGGDDDDAASITINVSEIPAHFKNPDGTYTFLAPDLKPITLPLGLKSVKFSTSDALYYTATGLRSEDISPIGTVLEFVIEVDEITSVFSYKGSNGIVRFENENIHHLAEVVIVSSGGSGNNGNSNNITPAEEPEPYESALPSWDYYYDTLSKDRTQYNVILGFAFFENNEIGFNLMASQVNYSAITTVKHEYEAIQNCFFAVTAYLSEPETIPGPYDPVFKKTGAEMFLEVFTANQGTKVAISSGLKVNQLTAGAKAYLIEHKEYTGSNNILAPVLIAIAQWASMNEFTESYSNCILGASSPAIGSILRLENHTAYENHVNPYSSYELHEQMSNNDPYIQQQQANITNSALYEELFEAYSKLIETYEKIKNGTYVQVDINSIVDNATTYEEIIDVLNQYSGSDKCVLENLNIDSRIKAINLLEPENEEELILELIKSTTFNAQASVLVDRIFQPNEDGITLFERLWDRFHGAEFHELIKKLSELKLVAHYGMPTDAFFELGSRGQIWSEGAYRSGQMDIRAIDYEWVDGNKFTFKREYYDNADYINQGQNIRRYWTEYNTYNYDDIIEIQFASNAQDILKYDDSYVGKTIALPAFHLAYLVYERNKDQNLKAVRVLGNLIVIATAFPSGGASVSLAAGISIALATTDIIVTCNEDKLKETEAGRSFLQAWEVIQWADAAMGAVTIGKGLYKSGTTVARNFKFVFNELDARLVDEVATGGTYGKSLVDQLRIAIKKLENVGFAAYASLINTKIIARLEATIVKAKYNAITEDAELLIKSEIEGFVKVNGTETKVFNMKPSSNGAFIEPTKSVLTNRLSATDEVIGKMDNVRFQKGNNVVTENLYIVETPSGIRLAAKNSADAFIHKPTSGALINSSAKPGSFLVGSYPTDLKYMLGELSYPKIQSVDFNFPVPPGQKFNLLNISDAQYSYWAANGGFFKKVNGPWIDAAVLQGADIIVVSKMESLYSSPGVLSGFGKEIHRLEWKHGYRYNPTTKMMVPPSQADGLVTRTLQSEYTH